MLCALGHGVAYYAVKSDSGSMVIVDYMRDRDKGLFETKYAGNLEGCFYVLYSQLLDHLNRSILNVNEMPSRYGMTMLPVLYGNEVP